MTARKGPSAPAVQFEGADDLSLVGARGKAPPLRRLLDAIDSTEEANAVALFVVDARAVCGASHLASAVLHAQRAQAAGERRARDEKVEVMLYLTGQRQIEKAIKRAGVSATTKMFGVVARGPRAKANRAIASLLQTLGLARDDAVLAATASKARRLLGRKVPAVASDLEALALEHTAMFRLE